MRYLVRHRGVNAPTIAAIDQFHASSGGSGSGGGSEAREHRPRAIFSMEYDDAGIYIAFHVADRYVISRRTERQAMVCKDSCVEAFLQPRLERGYFNFETNCCGTMLVYYVTDPTREPGGGLKAFVPVADELLDLVRIDHSMTGPVMNEIATPVEWSVNLFIPDALFERYVGPLGPPANRRWRGNFYKCADESSHPHWSSWNPIGAELNFHTPHHFGEIVFA